LLQWLGYAGFSNIGTNNNMIDLEKRFFNKIDIESSSPTGCWDWGACKDSSGYGQFKIDGKQYPAHRVSFEYFHNRKIKLGYLLDHMCRNRACVRPDHLREVTPQINSIENNNGRAAINNAKICCINGHKFIKENTYIRPSGGRKCRICMKEQAEKYRKTDKCKEYHKQYYFSYGGYIGR